MQEIRRVSEITPVPRAPEFIRGVINLRGRIMPVVDLKRKLRPGEVEIGKAVAHRGGEGARAPDRPAGGRGVAGPEGARVAHRAPAGGSGRRGRRTTSAAWPSSTKRLIILMDLLRILAQELREGPSRAGLVVRHGKGVGDGSAARAGPPGPALPGPDRTPGRWPRWPCSRAPTPRPGGPPSTPCARARRPDHHRVRPARRPGGGGPRGGDAQGPAGRDRRGHGAARRAGRARGRAGDGRSSTAWSRTPGASASSTTSTSPASPSPPPSRTSSPPSAW